MKIGILSRNHKQYLHLLVTHTKAQSTVKYEEIITSDRPSDLIDSQVDVLLANPNLAAEIVTSLDHLRWMQSTWAGVNRLIFQDKKNYQLSGLKGIFGQKMSEYVFAYLLSITRRLDGYKHLQHNKQWVSLPSRSLATMSIGIMGMGSIGEHVAQHAKLFGMKVIGLSRQSKSKYADLHFHPTELNKFAKQCDVIVNLLPETSETIGLCDKHFFDCMKAGSIFMNVGRGSVIKDELNLHEALSSGQLDAAVIDVCQQEPLQDSHPFWTNEKVFLSNHTAAVSDVEDVFAVFWKNLNKFIANQTIDGLIDFDRGY